MAVPAADPGKYHFNPQDDRAAVDAGRGEEYRQLAVADEALGELLEAYDLGVTEVSPKVQQAIKQARNAVRRAGVQLIIFHA